MYPIPKSPTEQGILAKKCLLGPFLVPQSHSLQVQWIGCTERRGKMVGSPRQCTELQSSSQSWVRVNLLEAFQAKFIGSATRLGNTDGTAVGIRAMRGRQTHRCRFLSLHTELWGNNRHCIMTRQQSAGDKALLLGELLNVFAIRSAITVELPVDAPSKVDTTTQFAIRNSLCGCFNSDKQP